MIRVFVEGRDSIFIKKYLHHIVGHDDANWEVISAGGYTKLYLIDQLFEENTEAGGKNLIIFDADSVANGGGFEERMKYLTNQMQELSIKADVFLFPNNKDDGDFETLLEHIINEEHRCLLECFEGYERCISCHLNEDGSPKYITPNRKSKIYAYLESIRKTRKESELFKNKKEFFFDSEKFWNLDSEYLNPLRTFLLTNVDR